MFFAITTHFSCKLLTINMLMVEAAGVALVLSIENTQLTHSRIAWNSQISMSARFAYKSRTNNSQKSRTSNSFHLPIRLRSMSRAQLKVAGDGWVDDTTLQLARRQAERR
jgi:hypothetical protein